MYCESVLWLFLTLPWVGLQCVIVMFPDQTHLLISLFSQSVSEKKYENDETAFNYART